MKMKYIYLLLLTPILAFSGINTKQVTDVLSHIKSEKTLSFFSTNKSFIDKLGVKKANSIKGADVLLFPKGKIDKKLVIVGSYSELQKNKKSIGAIYLKKGRTQIMFVGERLKKEGLKISDKYKKYLITECHLNPVCFLKVTK